MNALQEEFNSIEKLYHYTRFESCIKIIKSNTLLFGRLKDMNDINEFYRPLFYSHYTCKNAKLAMKTINQLQQISLSRDVKKKMGFEISSMWGHYADSGKGVCLVLDKQKLLKELSNSALNILYKGEISYTSNFTSGISMNFDRQGHVKLFTQRELKQYFFKKTKDWAPEQEYRILAQNNINRKKLKLPIHDSLIAIIMHNASEDRQSRSVFSSERFCQLSKMFNPAKIWEYGAFADLRNIGNYKGDTIWSSCELNRDEIIDI